jgi:hypothetical protein
MVAELNSYQPPAPARQAAAQAAPPTLSPNALAPVRTALAHIQAMAVEAMLSGLGTGESGEVPGPAEQQARPDPATRLPMPEAAAQRVMPPPAHALAGHPVITPEKEAAAAATGKTRGEGTAGTAADAPPPDAPRQERMAGITLQLPLYLPGSEMPLRLQISREQPEAEPGEPAPREASWMVRFSSETGRLGPIHAAISLVDGHVGVQLWAERGDTAEWFRSHSSQLRDALIASDVELDAVRISHGSPLAPMDVRVESM